MSITKYEKDGKTFYEVFAKTKDRHGKQRCLRRRGYTSLNDARNAELDLKISLRGFKDKHTWQYLVDRFLELNRLKYKNSTFVGYKFNFEKWVNPAWKDRFIDEITTGDVHALIFQHMQGVSGYTQKNILKIIKRAFQFALEDNLITRNPAVGINIKVAETQQGALNHEEITIFLREAKAVNHRFYSHWALALLTGMRSGELQALRWSDVDFTNGTISISKSWSRYNGEGPTKTSRNRVCPISGEARKFLQELKLQTGRSEYVLAREWQWGHGQLAAITREFCRSIGISEVTFHDLRATFITQLLINGVSTSKVMAIVGHSSLKTTETYLRLCGKDIEGATEALNITLPSDSERNGKVFQLRR